MIKAPIRGIAAATGLMLGSVAQAANSSNSARTLSSGTGTDPGWTIGQRIGDGTKTAAVRPAQAAKNAAQAAASQATTDRPVFRTCPSKPQDTYRAASAAPAYQLLQG